MCVCLLMEPHTVSLLVQVTCRSLCCVKGLSQEVNWSNSNVELASYCRPAQESVTDTHVHTYTHAHTVFWRGQPSHTHTHTHTHTKTETDRHNEHTLFIKSSKSHNGDFASYVVLHVLIMKTTYTQPDCRLNFRT